MESGLVARILGGQALAAARAATGDDLLAVLGRHARTEAVTALAHEAGRLKGPLHFKNSRRDGSATGRRELSARG
jgi:hypothetical protein